MKNQTKSETKIGARLLLCRETLKRGVPVADVAEDLGITREYLYAIEGDAKQPSYDLLTRIVTYYSTSFDYLFGHKEEKLPDGTKEIVQMMQDMSARARSELQAIVQAVYQEDLKWRQYEFGVDAMENAFGPDFNEKLKNRLAFLIARLGSEDAALAHIRDSILAEENG